MQSSLNLYSDKEGEVKSKTCGRRKSIELFNVEQHKLKQGRVNKIKRHMHGAMCNAHDPNINPNPNINSFLSLSI